MSQIDNPGGSGGGVAVSLGGNTAGVLALVSTGTLHLQGGDNVTVSQNGQSVTISAAAGAATNVFTAGMSNVGNTSGTTGVADRRMIFAGGNGVTLSQSLDAAASSGTITISVAAQTLQTQVMSAGLSNIGNTAGDTGLVSRQLILAGGNGITLSGSTNGSSMTVTVSGITQSVQTQALSAGLSNIGNTSGDTGLVSRQMVFAGGDNITLSGSTNGSSMTITISAAAAGGGGTLQQWAPYTFATDNRQMGQSTLKVQPLYPMNNVAFTRVELWLSVSISSSSDSSHAGTLSFDVGLYTRSVSTLSLASSGAMTFAWTNTSNNSFASLSGLRMVSVPLTGALTPGNYWLGVLSRTASGGTNWATLSNRVLSIGNNAAGSFGAAGVASQQVFLGHGQLSVQTAALPTAIPFADLIGTNVTSNATLIVNFANYTA